MFSNILLVNLIFVKVLQSLKIRFRNSCFTSVLNNVCLSLKQTCVYIIFFFILSFDCSNKTQVIGTHVKCSFSSKRKISLLNLLDGIFMLTRQDAWQIIVHWPSVFCFRVTAELNLANRRRAAIVIYRHVVIPLRLSFLMYLSLPFIYVVLICKRRLSCSTLYGDNYFISVVTSYWRSYPNVCIQSNIPCILHVCGNDWAYEPRHILP